MMAIDPAARGGVSSLHVSLHEARSLARGLRTAVRAAAGAPSPATNGNVPASRMPARAATASRSTSSRSFAPHTAIRSTESAAPDQWDGMLNRLGKSYNVPPLFLKAVMLAESGGRPDAVGDSGHSVGLFQLHDQGYGAGMGDRRYDPEVNAARATQGLAEAWHAGVRAGYSGELAVRAAYDYSFNPGGGFAYQGAAVVKYYNQLLAEQGLPPLA